MAGVESSRIYNEVPAIQFRSLNQFVADLAAGVVDTVYHDVGAGAHDGADWTSCFRAVVVGDVGQHIASLSFRRAALIAVDARGVRRAVEYEEQYVYQAAEHAVLVEVVAGRLAEIGVLSLREGLLELPHWRSVVHARRPKVVGTVRVEGTDA